MFTYFGGNFTENMGRGQIGKTQTIFMATHFLLLPPYPPPNPQPPSHLKLLKWPVPKLITFVCFPWNIEHFHPYSLVQTRLLIQSGRKLQEADCQHGAITQSTTIKVNVLFGVLSCYFVKCHVSLSLCVKGIRQANNVYTMSACLYCHIEHIIFHH